MALRQAISRPGRLVRTAIAITVGVAFVAGTYVLTDTTVAAFDQATTAEAGRNDLVVRSVAQFQGEAGGGDRQPMSDDVVEQVTGVEGVAAVDAGVLGFAQIVAPDGDPIVPTGPPALGMSWGPAQPTDDLVAGRPPVGPDEVVIDENSYNGHGFSLGDEVEVHFAGPSGRFTLVGVYSSANLLGASLAVFDMETAQNVLSKEGLVDHISVKVAPDASVEEVAGGLRETLDDGIEVVTDQQNRDEVADSYTSALSGLNTVMLVFAGVALLVAGFLISNTFAILLTQRTRELGLLRAIGARRDQVTRSVLGEALLIGGAASLVGLLLGVVMAIGMVAMIRTLGFDLPSTDPVVRMRTVVVALLAGLLTSLVSAYWPARRAGALSPMVAIAGGEPRHVGDWRRRAIVGAVLVAVGALVILVGVGGDVDGATAWVGLGSVVAVAGVIAAAVLAVGPVARAVGTVLVRLFGEPAEIGRENSVRDARRTAATASALIIGLGAVGFVAIVAESTKASAVAAVDASLRADLVVMPEGTFSFTGFSPEIGEAVAAIPEVGASSALRSGLVGLDGDARNMFAVDPGTIAELLDYGVSSADLADLGPGRVAVSRSLMRSEGWTVGDSVELTFARTGDVEMEIVVEVEADDLQTDSDFLVSLDTYDANFTTPLDMVVYLKLADGVDPEQGRRAVEDALERFPAVRTVDMNGLKDLAGEQVDQVLIMTSALLALSLLIAFIGIANTLGLSIAERTRELGLMRAVGMTNRQLKRMVRTEAAIIAVLGAVLGLLVSVVIGWAVVRTLGDTGINVFRIPWTRMAVMTVAAVLAAGLAASGPARRAGRLPVLEAIAGG